MKTNKSIILAGTALAGTAVATLFAGAAMAQSTGSQTVEVIIKGGPRSTGGLAVQTAASKDQSIVNKEYLDTLVGSASFADAISLLPGVSYSTEDPIGMTNGDLRIHGFDGAHVSVTVDGVPVNDSGSYGIFPNEYSVLESIDHITVDLGQTEVDSPTASAIGGTVNVVTKIPDATPSVAVNASAGSYDYDRLYGEVQTGAMGPTGLRAYFSLYENQSEKYKGLGEPHRWGTDGRLYQPLDNGGFLSVAYTYAEIRNDKYLAGTAAQYAEFGRGFDYDTQYAPQTATPGVADKVPSTPAVAGSTAFQAGQDFDYYKIGVSPSNTGIVRGQSKFNYGDKATLTVDPYFVYNLANGGGAFSMSESDVRLQGAATSFPTCKVGKAGQKGVDINGDGDCLDSVLLYNPNNTETFRYGVNSSFIYRFTDTQTLQVAATVDDAHLRQTGGYSLLNPDGSPTDPFGAVNPADSIKGADGSPLEFRNRYSIAKLNQIALNYIGRFMDDKLHVNVGIRNPHFERDLSDYCYTYNDTTAWCYSGSQAAVDAAVAKDNAAASRIPGHEAAAISALTGQFVDYAANGTVNWRDPFKGTFKFTKVLPNAGLSYDLDEHNAFYLTYAQGFSAPITDDLYETPQATPILPETTDDFGAGWRYRNSMFNVSVNPWASTWHNHIVSEVDPLDDFIRTDRNVGEVKLYGLDVEGGWTVTPNFNLYGSAAYTHSRMENGYLATVTGGPDFTNTNSDARDGVLPVAGKQAVMVPTETFALRANYHKGPFSVGLSTHYTGRRFTSDVNDAWIKANTLTNLDASYRISGMGKDTKLQLNIYNLFNAQYFSRAQLISNLNTVTAANGDTFKGNSQTLSEGAPIEAMVTLKTRY